MAEDVLAKEFAARYGMTPDLHIPIAARTIDAISTYIGTFSRIFPNSDNALMVTPYSIPLPNKKLPIWKVKGVEILHSHRQVWVRVNYTNYRKAYAHAFPEEEINDLVVDHVMNRRVARLKGYEYLRVTLISRAANSSSGNFTEKYGFAYHKSQHSKYLDIEKQPSIQYCDKADIVKMLNINTGGKIQEGINEVLYYFYEQ
ncbi:MAG: hypothetical protein V4590_00980 [Bacteroidota bacterium]